MPHFFFVWLACCLAPLVPLHAAQLALTAPSEYQVVHRDSLPQGTIAIRGRFGPRIGHGFGPQPKTGGVGQLFWDSESPQHQTEKPLAISRKWLFEWRRRESAPHPVTLGHIPAQTFSLKCLVKACWYSHPRRAWMKSDTKSDTGLA